MQVTTVSRLDATSPSEVTALKAGAQFEGVLLNMVFGDLERTFSQLPGFTQDAVAKSYAGYAVEGLTSGLAAAGGIGIGRFIARALTKHEEGQMQGI
jgi:hypothetical protein